MRTDVPGEGPDTSGDSPVLAPGPDGDTEIELLLPLALSQPTLASTRAKQVLLGQPGPRAASIAHQAIGIVERDTGRYAEAVVEVRTALRFARRCDSERVADVLATYGVVLAYAGHTSRGLRCFDEALPLTPRLGHSRLLLRRAHVLCLVGRYEEALDDLRSAIAGSRRAGDTLWEARGLNNRCLVHLALGDTSRADTDARRAGALFEGVGQLLESAHALHNRALSAHQRGDLPEALTLMDAVTEQYRDLGVLPADLVIDHAQALLTAGLAGEARSMSEDALANHDLPPVKRAELLLIGARACLADDDRDTAQGHAELARRLFAAQRRAGWADRAALLALQIQFLAGPVAGRGSGLLLRQSGALAASFQSTRATETPVALLLHGRVAHRSGHDSAAEASLTAAARSRHTGPPLGRAAGWLAAALLADHGRDRRALLAACRRGLDAVDEHRATLGDLELRALATGHGLEFVALALDEAVLARDSRALLWWAERWRATALVITSVRPVSDPDLERGIAALRDVARRLDAADEGTPVTSALGQERSRREAEVRRSYRHLRGSGAAAMDFDLPAVIEALGDSVLLSLVNVSGTLHAVTVARGRVSQRVVGPTTDALREAEFARFALRRAAYGRPTDLTATATRLQAALLGTPAASWSAARVVVVPPADLLTAPWGLLPVFASTSLTVSPSATLWLKAHRAAAGRRRGHVALVTGPGLSTEESEVTALSPVHDEARVVGGAEATVAGALEVLEGAGLAHVAAHGTFRADAPLFSSLSLFDGPLTVHDLDRLRRPPRSMVLSACDSGGAAPIAAHEALGLVSSLLAMGTSAVLASVVPVNDPATVTVMQQVHEVAGRGGTLADGWLAARQAAAGDALMTAAAAAFTAWGA